MPKDETITFRLPRELKELVGEWAKVNETSVSQILCELIRMNQHVREGRVQLKIVL